MRAISPYRFKLFRQLLIWLLAFSLSLYGLPVYARPSQTAAPQEQQAASLIPNDQLDSLVAPIALYPDPLLAQVLAASTYPLEVIQLQQWLQSHPGLKNKALTDAVEKEDWDPSVQGLAPLPDAVKQLSENIKWTTDLGNAFLAQQGDVMDAVQRMRMKAKSAGALTSNAQQKVETQVVESKTVVVIQQANPQVIYVPTYNPVVVYGPPVYPYPPHLLSSGGCCCCHRRHQFWYWHGHWSCLGRRLGIRLRVGTQQHQHQRPQQLCQSLQQDPTSTTTTSMVEATTGSIIRSTAAALLTQTGRQQINTAARLAAIPWPHDKRMRGKTKGTVNRLA
jgi:Protein of unknown function (DUF3300)